MRMSFLIANTRPAIVWPFSFCAVGLKNAHVEGKRKIWNHNCEAFEVVGLNELPGHIC